MSDTFDPIAFLSAVSGDGDWSDEFLAWYEPGKWLSDERACAAFIAEKFVQLQASEHHTIASFLERTGQYVTNDASREAAISEAVEAECAALRAFAQAIMGNWPDVGGLDGFDLQVLGHKHGLLKPEIRFAPCCEEEEGCSCADGADEDEWKAGITCYRKTPLLTGEKESKP